jgi:hypothetical protein
MCLRGMPFMRGGSIMRGASNKPPALVPLKGMHLFEDVQRASTLLGWPMEFPPGFPMEINTITV